MKSTFILILIGLFCFFSCCEVPDINTPIDFPCESDAVEIVYKEKQAESVQEFGMNIFQESVLSDTDANIVLSPLSIYSALLMVYEASACETKKQIMSTLGIGEGNQNVETGIEYLNFMSYLMPTDETVILDHANAFFSDQNRINTSSFYIDHLEEYYGGASYLLDFSEPSALETINQWAEENTQGKINKVLENIQPNELAFLLNTLIFSGSWANGFEKFETYNVPFTLKDGTEISTEMMHRYAETTYYLDDAFMMVDMDIKGGEYAVSFLTSSDDTPIDELILRNDFLDQFLSMIDRLENGPINISIPKFEVKNKVQLKDHLIRLGITDAFNELQADLTRMGTSIGNIHLGRVIHDTYLKVDEKGIEATAVTTVSISTNALPPNISIDKPFIFVLRHKETKVPIFIGKIENPTL